MELHSQTRKSICVCAREYIQQLQRREQRLRAQLMAHRLREQALVTALLQRGFSAEDIAALSAEASVNDLDSVAALVEGMVSDPKAG